jgi:hypothetical protein
VHFIRRKLWHFITQDDEDAENKWLKHLYGQIPVQCSSGVSEPMEELEEAIALDAFG